jgi:hypothetical protein
MLQVHEPHCYMWRICQGGVGPFVTDSWCQPCDRTGIRQQTHVPLPVRYTICRHCIYYRGGCTVIPCGCCLAQAVPVCTPVRFGVYPWIATVNQGQTDNFNGASTGNAHSPQPLCLSSPLAVLRKALPVRYAILPLDCYCNSGVNSRY